MGLSSVAFAADAASTTRVQQPAILPFTIRNITKRPRNRQPSRKRRRRRNTIKRRTMQLNRRLNRRHNGQGVKVINRR
ncbi:acid shock protein [Klebsiella pneumoniae]|nr:acid shock protein [Klebsiella pneumoniae]